MQNRKWKQTQSFRESPGIEGGVPEETVEGLVFIFCGVVVDVVASRRFAWSLTAIFDFDVIITVYYYYYYYY